jgi:hypothetical protein
MTAEQEVPRTPSLYRKVAEDIKAAIAAGGYAAGTRLPSEHEPEAVSLASHTPVSGSESGPLTGTVIAVTFLGATSRVTVDLGDTTVLAQLPTSEATTLSAGGRVALAIRPDPVLVSAGSDPAAPAAGEEA